MTYLLKSPYNNECGTDTLYLQADSEELHQYNKKRFGASWKWFDSPIRYKMNQYGYRMDRELDEVDFNNYIAFFGCSFCVGVGLPLEETYAHRIAATLDMDYVNGGIGGSNPEFVMLNVIELLSTAPKKPQVIIINWPQIHRQQYWYDNVLQFKGLGFSTCSTTDGKDYWNDAYKSTVMEDSHLLNRFTSMKKTVELICKLAGVELFQFTTYQQNFIKNDAADIFFSKFPELWLAVDPDPILESSGPGYLTASINNSLSRDITKQMVGHPGINHQNIVVDKFFREVKL